jgi:hypothetical protein
MIISYWECNFSDADQIQFGVGDFGWCYYCNHPDGDKYCPLDNKWNADEDNCKLLDSPIENQTELK